MAMPLGATLRIGLDSLRANPLRTLLATSGVVIGVAALVSVLSLGDGMERLGRSQIERNTSLKLVTVSPRTVQVRDRVLVPIGDPIELGPADLRIKSASVVGKKLLIFGQGIREGTKVLLNGVEQPKIKHSNESPETNLTAKKSGRQIQPGQTVDLQLRNPDGSTSPVFRFVRP